MSAPENPTAFPVILPPGYEWAENGMTLRDWFAGQALLGLSTDHSLAGLTVLRDMAQRQGITPGRLLAAIAYERADAMLTARQQDQAS